MADIVNVEEVVGTLHAGIEASQTVPAVLDFAKKEMQEQRSYSERLIARFMGKGRKPISDPDGDAVTVTGVEARPGDRWLLCSDGISDCLPDDAIA